MGLSSLQLARMSRLLDDVLTLDEAGRRRWLERVSSEHQDLAHALREALLPSGAWSASLEKLATLPKLGSVEGAGALGAGSLNPGERVGPYGGYRALPVRRTGAGAT